MNYLFFNKEELVAFLNSRARATAAGIVEVAFRNTENIPYLAAKQLFTPALFAEIESNLTPTKLNENENDSLNTIG